MMFTVPVSFSDGPYGVRPMASEGEEGGVCLREALEIVDVQLRSHGQILHAREACHFARRHDPPHRFLPHAVDSRHAQVHCAQKPYLSNPSPCLAMRWANSDATHFRLGLFRD